MRAPQWRPLVRLRLKPRTSGSSRSIAEQLDKRKNDALVAVALCTGTLITCLSIAFSLM